MSGGGGSSSQPTQQTVTQTNIPKELMPYAMQTLGQASALTSQPYQAYQGPQVAGFSDLQNQAFKGIGELGPSPALNEAVQRAMNINYAPAQLEKYQMQAPADVTTDKFGQSAADQYMSPYMQNVLDQQKKAAVADYARALPQLGASAVRAGGMGGTRNALMEAEANRNLQNSLQGIDATGRQAAYQQAMAQFNADQARQLQAAQGNQQTGLSTGIQNLQALLGVQNLGEQSRQFGANLGLQGLQAAMGGAGQQFNQQLQALNAQQGAGALQQQLQQQQYNQDMQNWANAQNYPYKQLGFMSDLIRGTPTGSSVSTMYGGQPSTAGQLAGLGTLLYGSGMKG